MFVLTILGTVLFVLGTLLTCLNFYLSFVRVPLIRLRYGADAKYRNVSVFPVFGSLFLWTSMPLLTAYPAWMWTAGVISLFDTGGLHWFVIMVTWMRFTR